MLKYFIITILFLPVAFALGQQTVIYDSAFLSKIEKARLYIDSLKKAQNIPAISISVGVRGKQVWSEAIGYSNLDKNEIATVQTKFRVGSISKSMTSFALGKLFDQGKLEFDDNAGKYLAQFEKKEFDPTIRQIAGHQSGIRHYQGFEYLTDKQYNSVEESMSVFANDKLLFEPGSKYSYSTYGYVALSRIIEKITEQSYLDFMKQEIFDPLGMDNTVAENASADESNKATFYSKNGKRESGKVNLSSKWAGGGFLSSPQDLVSMVNRATKIMSAQTLFMLVTPQKLKNGDVTDYGIGWRYTTTQKDQRVLVHHGGTSVGARAFLMILLNEQVVVAVCTNSEAEYNAQEVYNIAKFFL